MGPVKLKVTAYVTREGAEPFTRIVIGRDAWALMSLILAGHRGCTPIQRPAPRWSHYIFKLRRAGIDVETIDEKHAGSFAGTHARYVLRDKVTVSGGTLDEYLQSPEGRRAFPVTSFWRAAA